MWDWVYRLFREYTPIKQTFNGDNTTMWLDVAGSIGIGIAFLVFGLLIISFSTKPLDDVKFKTRIIVSKFFGWALIACAFARFITADSVWVNYALFHALVKDITAILGFIALGLTPSVLRKLKEYKSINQVHQTLIQTQKKLEEVKEISKKLDDIS